ncbi:hypothetical protein T310_0555 [Rasamsonia emersonii CBS 393.64]|uniref:Uncharacterized protein n=1 Tax=Rasamsonia emersonii (strain ATCC 16479 / CBS 393.64 / IMI 116815) TaxID=1408163 RepID=A0A0F4Z4D5_RASE3|nr:hypothetical protein T310_0555 [Rasamsonia emersonii CBS 393.64]KKA25377.1 hypothetical protein T310_0555 [Rasamsonia emersonii CBS 393.64]
MARTLSPQSVVTSFVRWIRLKNYQYEVTFALYMLTPTEKLIFTAYIYLPDHVAAIYGRIRYYLAGDTSLISEYIPTASSILKSSGTSSLGVVYETARGSPTTAVKTIAEL